MVGTEGVQKWYRQNLSWMSMSVPKEFVLLLCNAFLYSSAFCVIVDRVFGVFVHPFFVW